MTCEKCGKVLPDDVKTCPDCGESLPENPAAAEKPAEPQRDHTAIRSETIPQRPRTAYPDRGASRQAARHRRNLRTVRLVVLILVILGLLTAAIFIGVKILHNGNETDDLGEQDPVSTQPEANPDADLPAEDDPVDDQPEDVLTYDLAGVWIWDADMALMKETVWQFAEDGSLTIYYFGLGEFENPFTQWPGDYTYEKDTGILTLAGERIPLVWKNENGFTMHSSVLGICDAKRTDAEHIPTGAEDIRTLDGTMPEKQPDDEPVSDETPDVAAYFFQDSNSRYLKKSELESLTADELRLARNEIYARHGRRFDSADLQTYFDSQDWYIGTTDPDSFNYDILNDYERYNVNLMRSVEDAKR
ncbi:MAG: YARHG domain-containing protein [Ruminococcaceae bacterium]|nr:YARHG domain-containing protein [Oscillospiraceae bacterium]